MFFTGLIQIVNVLFLNYEIIKKVISWINWDYFTFPPSDGVTSVPAARALTTEFLLMLCSRSSSENWNYKFNSPARLKYNGDLKNDLVRYSNSQIHRDSNRGSLNRKSVCYQWATLASNQIFCSPTQHLMWFKQHAASSLWAHSVLVVSIGVFLSHFYSFSSNGVYQ